MQPITQAQLALLTKLDAGDLYWPTALLSDDEKATAMELHARGMVNASTTHRMESTGDWAPHVKLTRLGIKARFDAPVS